MIPVTRSRSVVSRPAVMAALGFLPLGLIAASAQTPPRAPTPPRTSSAVPFLFGPGFSTANLPGLPAAPPPKAGAPLNLNPALNPPSHTGSLPAAATNANADALRQREQELVTLRAEQKKALDNEARLRGELDSIGDDRRKLNQELIETAQRVRDVEAEIDKTQDRLAPLDGREQALRNSLAGRRNAIAEVLAALQRIGRHPPPAILVQPEDALQSVRSALLLGAVLPDMRQETERLIADLTELVRLRKEIAEERTRLDRDLAALTEGQQRLSFLVEQRQKQQTEAEQVLAAERQRAGQLARQAEDAQALIAALEQGPSAARTGPRGAEDKRNSGRPDLAALKDPGRLAPAVPFPAAKGKLPLPVNGARIREFGGSDGLGGTEKGLSIAARAGAQITSPCDGWVVYAGPFRNYGQLLILSAGAGYHVLLAGMERISVDLGQFVVTGEPVAKMGGRVLSAAARPVGSSQPVLYIEFRKDGTPVDPGPWWAASESEKVRG